MSARASAYRAGEASFHKSWGGEFSPKFYILSLSLLSLSLSLSLLSLCVVGGVGVLLSVLHYYSFSYICAPSATLI